MWPARSASRPGRRPDDRPSLRPARVASVATTRFGKHLDRSLGSLTEEVVDGALKDACAFAELLQYEQVGIVPTGRGADAARDGRTGPGGSAPVNSGGCMGDDYVTSVATLLTTAG